MHPFTVAGESFVSSNNSLPQNHSTGSEERDVTPMSTAPHQMTYFLTTEESIDSPGTSSHPTSFLQRARGQNKHNMFIMDPPETRLSSENQDRDSLHKILKRPLRKEARNPAATPSSKRSEDDNPPDSMSSSTHSSRDSSSADLRAHTQNKSSASFTPVSLSSTPPGHVQSFMTSRRNSAESLFTDDAISPAVVSSEEDEKEAMFSQVMDSGSIPQLVMPSIKMPSRRPFTDKGKNMGRLKVLIAGDSGVGKTSLIKAIVQICEDIVHVDPLAATSTEIAKSSRKLSKSRARTEQATALISEVYASTRPYPSWWSEVDDFKVLRRRKSMGDTVLERNLCFVDTPGYSRGMSCMESINLVVDYVESQFGKMANLATVSDGELLNLMSGGGGFQVDVVFYTVRSRVAAVDIEYLRRLSVFTNIILLITQCDMFLSPEIETLKASIASELENANVALFSFGRPQKFIYAVSTIASPDEENMDASILMSPDYIQPIIRTDLADLVSDVFNTDSVCHLRHSAVAKYMKWRKKKFAAVSSLPVQINHSLSASAGPSTSSLSSGMLGPTSTYALARIADHTRREEQLAQVRLSKWAHDLQQSIHNERARYEALCRGERAVWLTERLGECVRDGTLVARDSPGALLAHSDNGGTSMVQPQTYWRRKAPRHKSDPLGLISFNARLRRCSWIALQVVGSLGVVGGFAIWLGSGRSWWGFVGEDTKAGLWLEWERLGWSRW